MRTFMSFFKNILTGLGLLFYLPLAAQALYDMPKGVESRVSTFENPKAQKGRGAMTNKGVKGNAFEWIQPGESKTLLDVEGQGTVQRIWMTINQNPVKLRSLRLQMFWDHATIPAVDVPMGDFFAHNLGQAKPFHSALFSSPEGRSFNCFIPMPFRKHARMVLINEGTENVRLFYEVDFLLHKVQKSALYFHAYWNRHHAAEPGTDYVALPKIEGRGRFLGMSMGVLVDSVYGKTWWGEGELKMYLDGDAEYPTIAGTGIEDYIGTAWEVGVFSEAYQGCTVAQNAPTQVSFYRWHIPDAVYFNKDIKVTVQQLGGARRDALREVYRKNNNLKVTAIHSAGKLIPFLEMPDPPELMDDDFPNGWVYFQRVDDYSSVCYFYLDKAAGNLPPLPDVQIRIKGLK
jgi:Protein of unknown function (DUF2961)